MFKVEFDEEITPAQSCMLLQEHNSSSDFCWQAFFKESRADMQHSRGTPPNWKGCIQPEKGQLEAPSAFASGDARVRVAIITWFLKGCLYV